MGEYLNFLVANIVASSFAAANKPPKVPAEISPIVALNGSRTGHLLVGSALRPTYSMICS
jgi:hypothetical protein